MTVTEPVHDQPHFARLVIGRLLDTEAVTDLVGREVVTDVNANRLPAIRVTQFPGRMVSGSSIHWLGESLLQVDCFWSGGSDRHNAHQLAIAAQSALATMRGAQSFTIGDDTLSAVVTGVEVFGIADTESTLWDPPKPYSRFDVLVTAHPLVSSGS